MISAIVQGIAHGTLVATYRPKHGAEEAAVVDAMRAHHFNFGGAPRSYWDFYVGYAIMAVAACFAEAAVLAQGAFADDASGKTATGIAATFAVFNLVHAAIATRFFFPLPGIFDASIAALLIASLAIRRAGGR